MVLLVVGNRLKALFLVLLGIIKRSLCCLRRRRKSSCDSVPLTAVGIGSTYEQNTSSNELHSWNTWDESISVVSEPTTVQHHIELYRQQQAARKLSESQSDDPQPDFFQDMTPKITKQPKILIKTQSDKADELSSRLSFPADAFIPPSGPELGTWEEKEGNEVGSWEEAEGWDTAQILRDKRKAEREHRATLKREHMRSTLGSKVS